MSKIGVTVSFIKDVVGHISRKIQGTEEVPVFFSFQSAGHIILLDTSCIQLHSHITWKLPSIQTATLYAEANMWIPFFLLSES